jgi:hypothetical protein
LVWPESDSLVKRQTLTAQLKSQTLTWLSLANQWWLNLKQSAWWRLVPPKYQQLPIDELATDAATIFDYFTTGKKTILMVFQNSQELRATGGFMGSYARVELQDGLISQLEIQDIYQPAGQFKGKIAAPPGVVDYLSSGQGLKLPDANWWPDFPQSAQTVLSYFAFGKEQQIAGLMAVNLEVAEDLLRVLGPVTLKDYAVTVTADNLATVARADRAEFFPGSQQKAHFLSLLFDQLKFKVFEFRSSDLTELAKLWVRRAENKDLQFYSPVGQIQTLAAKYGLSGQTSLRPEVFGSFDPNLIQPTSLQPLYLQLVESNVGINKANSAMTRLVTAQVLASQIQIQIEYTNHHPQSATPAAQLSPKLTPNSSESANGLGYVNYQRVIVSPYLKVVSLALENESITNWHEAPVSWSGVNLSQIGFLVTVPEATQRKLTLVLEPDQTAPVANLLNLPGIMIQKQAGLPPTPYELFWSNQRQSLILETDTFRAF